MFSEIHSVRERGRQSRVRFRIPDAAVRLTPEKEWLWDDIKRGLHPDLESEHLFSAFPVTFQQNIENRTSGPHCMDKRRSIAVLCRDDTAAGHLTRSF